MVKAASKWAHISAGLSPSAGALDGPWVHGVLLNFLASLRLSFFLHCAAVCLRYINDLAKNVRRSLTECGLRSRNCAFEDFALADGN
jgi:hypothetical protein